MWVADGGGVATAPRRVAQWGAVGFPPCPGSAKQIPNAGNDAVLKCIACAHEINNLSITQLARSSLLRAFVPSLRPSRTRLVQLTPHLITQSIVFVTQVMARKPQVPPPSSKKMARQGKKKQPKKAQVYSSSSSESEAEKAGPA